MTKKAKYTIWGKDLDPAAISQMDDAVSLPVAIKGTLMPDAHMGYGLFIPFMKYETHKQLGTSGSGNHFAEFGKMTLLQDDIGLKSGGP